MYFMLGMYIFLALLSVYVNNVFCETLISYGSFDFINYDKFKTNSSVFMTVITFIIIAIVYLYIK